MNQQRSAESPGFSLTFTHNDEANGNAAALCLPLHSGNSVRDLACPRYFPLPGKKLFYSGNKVVRPLPQKLADCNTSSSDAQLSFASGLTPDRSADSYRSHQSSTLLEHCSLQPEHLDCLSESEDAPDPVLKRAYSVKARKPHCSKIILSRNYSSRSLQSMASTETQLPSLHHASIVGPTPMIDSTPGRMAAKSIMDSTTGTAGRYSAPKLLITSRRRRGAAKPSCLAPTLDQRLKFPRQPATGSTGTARCQGIKVSRLIGPSMAEQLTCADEDFDAEPPTDYSPAPYFLSSDDSHCDDIEPGKTTGCNHAHPQASQQAPEIINVVFSDPENHLDRTSNSVIHIPDLK